MENSLNSPEPEELKKETSGEQPLVSPVVPVPYKPKLPLVLLSMLLLFLFGFCGFLLSKSLNVSQNNFPTPTLILKPTAIPDMTADWKTYTNNSFSYSLRYPLDWEQLEVDKGKYVSFFKGPYITDQPIPEPNISVQVKDNPAQIPLREWLIGEKILPNDSNLESHTKESIILVDNVFGIKITTPANGGRDTVFLSLGKNILQITYVFNGENQTDYENLVITFEQILSTFKFLDQTSAQAPTDWKPYRNEKYGFEVKYNPELNLTESSGNGEAAGQFTYLQTISFGTNPIKSPYGYEVEINKKSLGDYRMEIVGHFADKIDSEEEITVNGNSWTKIAYTIFLTTDYISVTKAVINHGEYGYAVTASTIDIGLILSAFKFIDQN